MKKLLTDFYNLIFPPSENELLINNTPLNTFHKNYLPGKYHNIEFLSNYSKKVIRVAVTENKFHNRKSATILLGCLLEKWNEEQSGTQLFVPIPLGDERMKTRGYNQVELILNQVRPKLNINNKLLKRPLETKPQSELHKKDRQKNIERCFEFTGKDFNFTSYTEVIILDDVVTTGATMSEARAALSPHLPLHITLRLLSIAH